MNTKVWIKAARLRTLPLAISTMIMGHSLAAADEHFHWSVAVWSIITAISLQILSNFANDYGDSIHGADHAGREGPQRAVQSGAITLKQMKSALYVTGMITLISGIILIMIAFQQWMMRGGFIVLGLLAIWSAINYTAGSKPYGYRGMGDIAVFVFFGLVTVCGSYFLQTKGMRWEILLPAITCGALSVAVLNVNNIRDIQSDQQAGKQSIPVKIGRSAAIRYHGILLVVALLALIVFGIVESFNFSFKWIFLIATPLLIINFNAIRKYTKPSAIDPYLKQLALSTAAIILLFCIGLFL